MTATTDEAREMLTYIAPADHETRYRVGMALYSGLGPDGQPLFDQWLSRHDKYRSELRSWGASHWRGLGRGTSGRPIGFGTLVHLAREGGWRPNPDAPRPDAATLARESADARQRELAQVSERLDQARETEARARQMLAEAELTTHPYLASKGFPDAEGFVRDGVLLLPIFDVSPPASLRAFRQLRSVQTITEDGTKRFIFGSDMNGGGVRLGKSYAREVWYVEGYATALSVREALRQFPGADWQVIACMSDSGLAREAKRNPGDRAAYIIADHDDWLCHADPPHGGKPYRWSVPPATTEAQCPHCGSTTTLRRPAGERAAKASGLPWWTPERRGDANDVHQAEGLEVVVQAIRWLRAGNSLG